MFKVGGRGRGVLEKKLKEENETLNEMNRAKSNTTKKGIRSSQKSEWIQKPNKKKLVLIVNNKGKLCCAYAVN